MDRNDATAALGGAVIVGGLLTGPVPFGVVVMMPKVVERYTLDVDKSVHDKRSKGSFLFRGSKRVTCSRTSQTSGMGTAMVSSKIQTGPPLVRWLEMGF